MVVYKRQEMGGKTLETDDGGKDQHTQTEARRNTCKSCTIKAADEYSQVPPNEISYETKTAEAINKNNHSESKQPIVCT